MWVAFVDSEKAFDRSQSRSVKYLKKMCTRKLQMLLRTYLYENTCARTGNVVFDGFTANEGLRHVGV